MPTKTTPGSLAWFKELETIIDAVDPKLESTIATVANVIMENINDPEERKEGRRILTKVILSASKFVGISQFMVMLLVIGPKKSVSAACKVIRNVDKAQREAPEIREMFARMRDELMDVMAVKGSKDDSKKYGAN